MQAADYPAGATIISAGQEQDDRVFFIREGEVSVVLSLADGSHQRLATLSGGTSLSVDDPEIKIAVLRNLSLELAQKLRQANRLIGVFASVVEPFGLLASHGS